MEGMNAFLERRKPDFQQFRERNRDVVRSYLDGLEAAENRAPDKAG